VVTIPVAPFQETRAVNLGESTAKGIEIEMNWLPIDNLRIDANLGYLDHEYDSYSPSVDPVPLGLGDPGDPPIVIDLSSLTPPFSPELNYGVGLTYVQELGAGGSLTYNASLHYQDDFESDSFPANAQGADTSGDPIIGQKMYTQSEERTLVDAFVTWQNENRKLDVTLYGKNLTDEVWRSSGQSVAGLWNFTHHGAPREFGMVVGYNF
jgi:iron complex outermembrane receptor protein